MQDITSFLDPTSPRLRALGGGRFDQQQAPSPEWADFGSYVFMLARCVLPVSSAQFTDNYGKLVWYVSPGVSYGLQVTLEGLGCLFTLCQHVDRAAQG